MAGLIGRKIGMTRIFDEVGTAISVTIVEAGPCPVLQIKNEDTDGYAAVQLGFGAKKDSRASKAEKGHAAKAGVEVAPPDRARVLDKRGRRIRARTVAYRRAPSDLVSRSR